MYVNLPKRVNFMRVTVDIDREAQTLLVNKTVPSEVPAFIMSPPVGFGDILFMPWSSVRLSVCLSQNRVRSVTPKPFEIFSWNFTQI